MSLAISLLKSSGIQTFVHALCPRFPQSLFAAFRRESRLDFGTLHRREILGRAKIAIPDVFLVTHRLGRPEAIFAELHWTVPPFTNGSIFIDQRRCCDNQQSNHDKKLWAPSLCALDLGPCVRSQSLAHRGLSARQSEHKNDEFLHAQ